MPWGSFDSFHCVDVDDDVDVDTDVDASCNTSERNATLIGPPSIAPRLPLQTGFQSRGREEIHGLTVNAQYSVILRASRPQCHEILQSMILGSNLMF
jgi:hypothetical protein